jgi:hypothetical protein
MASGELACTYAALILSDDGIAITVRPSPSPPALLNLPAYSFWAGEEMRDCSSSWQAEKIATIVKAANIKVESYWPALFAKLLEKRNVEDLILSVGSGMHPPFAPQDIMPGVCNVWVVRGGDVVDLAYFVMLLVFYWS